MILKLFNTNWPFLWKKYLPLKLYNQLINQTCLLTGAFLCLNVCPVSGWASAGYLSQSKDI